MAYELLNKPIELNHSDTIDVVIKHDESLSKISKLLGDMLATIRLLENRVSERDLTIANLKHQLS